jgi:hypothetical protein
VQFSDLLTDESLETETLHMLSIYFDPEQYPIDDNRYTPALDLPDLADDIAECDADDCDDAPNITRYDVAFLALIRADIALYYLDDLLNN